MLLEPMNPGSRRRRLSIEHALERGSPSTPDARWGTQAARLLKCCLLAHMAMVVSFAVPPAGAQSSQPATTSQPATQRAASIVEGYTITMVDLADDTSRQVCVDREPGQYLGHVSTVLLEDGRTIIAVYPKGHGRGAIVMKRSPDGGLTWGERLPVPENWATSLETPTIHRVIDPQGVKRLILFSGLYPVRMSVSEDDGRTWTPLAPVGDWGGIVAMGSVERLRDGRYVALFHDDGRFFHADGRTTYTMTLYQTFSTDGGLTWSVPEAIYASSEIHLCEPGLVRSPDGRQLAILLRENRRRRNSHVMFSNDEAKTWTPPRELPGALTGDRHTARYAPDGRLFISFRDMSLESPTKGDWVGWVGRYDDIINAREGQYRVRLMKNHKSADCAYPGVEVLPDGTFVCTTYGHWASGEEPYVVSIRLKLSELDERSAGSPDEATELARWSADRDQRMAWWREARFGMFIHWGLYSGAGGMWDGKVYPQHYAEWIQHWAAVPCDEYARAMKPLFTPDPGVTDMWADLAKEAGMRYAVMTSKHHDGFTLFNSKQEYSRSNAITGSTNISPDGRDLAREFAESMRSRGLRAGFYYSLLDWQHPDAYEMALPGYPKAARQRNHSLYVKYVRGHVDELLSDYGPLCTIWFDYSDKQRRGAAWGAAQLLTDLRRKQPGILVNNRLFEGLENKNGDYGTPEKYVPPTGVPGMDWEVNHTLNESYGYSAHDTKWKDTTTVVRLLCDVVSKGGNLLLNIGPDARGCVPESAQATLRGVGAWMRVNSEAIYGTTASPFARLPWGRATQRPGTLYLMVFDWPADRRLIVPMRGAVKSARLLGRRGDLSFGTNARDGDRLEVRLPERPVDAACSVVKLELGGDVQPMPFVAFPGSDGVLTLWPHDAAIDGPSLRVEQVGAVEDVKYNLGYWLDASATASFPIGIGAGQEGEYVAEIEIACADASAGAKMKLETPAGELVFTVSGTGGWQQYRVVELGHVRLAAGVHRLVLAALNKPGEAVANVRSITLRAR